MEEQSVKNKDDLIIDSAKATKILEMILDKKVNIQDIKDEEVETEELNKLDNDKALEYIKEIDSKKYDIKDTENVLDPNTRAIKLSMKSFILDITYELKKYKKVETIKNLLNLACYYYLFKIQTAKEKNIENNYIIKIDETITRILLTQENKKHYYDILQIIFSFNQNIFESNKTEKYAIYFKIISLLNPQFLLKQIQKYMDAKKHFYPQYNISLPFLDLEKLEEIYNILYILKRTEKFKTQERFEYFQEFQHQNKLLLAVNYILNKLGKNIIISLDKSTDDIREEATKFSLNAVKKNFEQKEKYELILSHLEETLQLTKDKYDEMSGEKKEFQESYKKLNDEHRKLNDEHRKLNDKFKKYMEKTEKEGKDLGNKIREFEEEISKLRKELVESKTEKNCKIAQIDEFNSELQKKDDIIEKISYRDVSSRIIGFFSCSQPQSLKEKYEKQNISPRNINMIAEYISTHLNNYDKYMKENGADIRKVLNDIKKEKKVYDELVHDKDRKYEKYIELMSTNNKELGKKIEFIFGTSSLIRNYVFDKKNNVEESQIFEEFVKINEDIKTKK